MCATLGHGHPAILEAMRDAGERVVHLFSGFLSRDVTELARELMALLPEPLSRAMFLSTGGEANEAALRLAKLHTGGHEVLAFAGSWHGMTAGAASSTYSAGRRGYGPALPGHDGAADAERLPLPDRPLPRPLRPDLPRRRPRAGRRAVGRRARPPRSSSRSSARAGSCRCPRATSPACKRALRRARDAAGPRRGADRARPRRRRCSRSSSTTWCRTSSTLSKTLGGGLPLSATITTDAIEEDASEKGFLHVTSHVSDPLPAAVGRAVLRTVLAEDLGAARRDDRRAPARRARGAPAPPRADRRRPRRRADARRRPRRRPRDARAGRGATAPR